MIGQQLIMITSEAGLGLSSQWLLASHGIIKGPGLWQLEFMW